MDLLFFYFFIFSLFFVVVVAVFFDYLDLVDWQKTYGRLEIWEVDDYDRKYRQLYFEFQWNETRCKWPSDDNGNETEACDMLPLTGSTKYG